MSDTKSITAVPLTAEEYEPYGHVIESKIKSTDANFGTAKRFNFLATLDNNRESAKANVCLFRCSPRDLPFSIKLLERHLYSTQMFIPMTADKRYLVIVAQGGDKPDLSTLKAFVASKSQGITYYPGTWHHPMIALDNVTDFTCVVYEDGSQDDCHVEQLDDVITCYVN